ncbi:MAG: DUF4838 domain-containing protein [Victivallales bacterium]|nr:DUF4838 domain-containing protein [Victivallales bacterium]
MKKWEVFILDSSVTSEFAAQEFARLVACMDPQVETQVVKREYEAGRKGLWIGLSEAVQGLVPQVPDPYVDDAIHIDVQNGSGVITGANERSVLIAVYRFFREAGCVFVRPGRDGEYIPLEESLDLCVKVSERPAYRHRGICLEGSNSYENVVEMIDFAPKLGLNAYFTQLFRPGFAFRRWYEHQNNPEMLPTPVSDATIDSFVASYEVELRRRSLIHHRIGHGWAPKLLGITSSAWHEANSDDEVLPERKKLIALIDGKRELFHGSAIDTNLCYSEPLVKELLADAVVAYARENPEVRYLHFWLADQANNQCMCDQCKDKRPSDQYVEILNRIDEKLTEAGLPTKIVFLIYLDLLWAPLNSRLRNPDRFVLMYAPIRRSYSVPIASDNKHKAAPFVRNGFKLTSSAGGTLPYLKAWQKVFKGDSFVFDYHYMWDYLNDPGSVKASNMLAQDAMDLKELGLNGIMSCQNQRVFMPTGLAMNLLGETLWSGELDFESMRIINRDYFQAAFGDAGILCMVYLTILSEGFDPMVLRGEKPLAPAKTYAAIRRNITKFVPVIQKHIEEEEWALQSRSWEILNFHAALCKLLSYVLEAYSKGNRKKADSTWKDVRYLVCSNELRFQKEFDVFEFLNVWESKILPKLAISN